MFGILKRRRAAKSIPRDVYELIASIYSRYLRLDLGSGRFEGLSEREKLQAMIEYVNNDADLLRLESRSMIGSLIVVNQVRGNGTVTGAGSGSGLNVCFGHEGLYIYDWNDFADKWHNIPLTSVDALDGVGIQLTAEKLRDAIADYTEKKEYVDRVALFDKTFREAVTA
ncbi:MAG: hypothetical protein A3B91_04985 [Candidatus Yanofskybacteria bacterium RIFCSPHIGHO2_02_FULL_41_29]|nr:MAG: hypothetical protein A3B91_04985 [Candidatus Yanofskybacteria bacterium RIFCSPHIGHO2_02_FULL_41_29]OGN29581.1 MAG: hypothetical protein A3H54_01645 [Candidatus Yanofskybacteria bacterium RIFCSPLOWO2_02_FULL_41_13]